MARPHEWSRGPLRFAAAMLIALAAVLLAICGAFGPAEDALTKYRAELLHRPPTGQVAIVEIDARSLSGLNSWPWPRRYHAALVRQLHRSGASLIAFDVDFSARSDDGDIAFASAIREAGNVILPIFAQKASGQRDENRLLSSRPNADLADAWVGGVNIFPDTDGVVREYPAATFINGAVQPAIATLLAEENGLGDRSFQPDWAIDAHSIPSFSYIDIMNGRVPPGELRGKRVIVGATAVELGDRYTVPRYGILPGVVIQALAAESILQGRAMARTGLPVTLAGILAIALLLAPRPVQRAGPYVAQCVALGLGIIALPSLIEWRWPLSVDSAAWLFTLVAAVSVQAAVESRRRLRLRAQFDAESGLPNRTMLEQALDAERADPPILVTAAIERFDTIRDAVGLAGMNEIVRESADRIGTLTGSSIYRIAPDLLAWLETDACDIARNVARIESEFRRPVEIASGPVDVLLTLGLENGRAESGAVLRIERALAAIGEARSVGKKHLWCTGAGLQDRRQLSMMSELRDAMVNGSLRLAYQPKMALGTGSITDAEALVRWHGAEGIIRPDEFIPLAESTGVIRDVTMFVIRSALADLSRWAREGVPLRFAVNVSAVDLADDDFADEVDRLLAKAHVPPSQLTLEITESALIRSTAEAISTLKRLRAAGLRLSVDDYGTGQSTLSYLKNLPVHELKIDKSFITSLPYGRSDQILVRSTIELAHELGMEVVAEGIEDKPTLELLRDLGCDYGQGYFISKPVSIHKFAELSAGYSARRGPMQSEVYGRLKAADRPMLGQHRTSPSKS